MVIYTWYKHTENCKFHLLISNTKHCIYNSNNNSPFIFHIKLFNKIGTFDSDKDKICVFSGSQTAPKWNINI